MRSLFPLALILTAACGQPNAIIDTPNWVHIVDAADGDSFYVDGQSRRGPHQQRSAWILIRSPDGSEVRTQFLFNCSNATMANTLKAFLSGDVEGVDPGSIDADIYNYACVAYTMNSFGRSLVEEQTDANGKKPSGEDLFDRIKRETGNEVQFNNLTTDSNATNMM